MTNYIHAIEEWGLEKTESFTFEPSPCNDCKSYNYCAENEAACLDFSRYVNTGKIFNSKRDPSMAIYKRIFKRSRHGWT